MLSPLRGSLDFTICAARTVGVSLLGIILRCVGPCLFRTQASGKLYEIESALQPLHRARAIRTGTGAQAAKSKVCTSGLASSNWEPGFILRQMPCPRKARI